MRFILFFFLSEFIAVTLVNKVIQVSGARFNDMSSVHCAVGSAPQVKSLSVTISAPYTLLPFPQPLPWLSPHCVHVHAFFSLSFSFLAQSRPFL